jgi:hypothetical protein
MCSRRDIGTLLHLTCDRHVGTDLLEDLLNQIKTADDKRLTSHEATLHLNVTGHTQVGRSVAVG